MDYGDMNVFGVRIRKVLDLVDCIEENASDVQGRSARAGRLTGQASGSRLHGVRFINHPMPQIRTASTIRKRWVRNTC